jgi:hypothetical protein
MYLFGVCVCGGIRFELRAFCLPYHLSPSFTNFLTKAGLEPQTSHLYFLNSWDYSNAWATKPGLYYVLFFLLLIFHFIFDAIKGYRNSQNTVFHKLQNYAF